MSNCCCLEEPFGGQKDRPVNSVLQKSVGKFSLHTNMQVGVTGLLKMRLPGIQRSSERLSS